MHSFTALVTSLVLVPVSTAYLTVCKTSTCHIVLAHSVRGMGAFTWCTWVTYFSVCTMRSAIGLWGSECMRIIYVLTFLRGTTDGAHDCTAEGPLKVKHSGQCDQRDAGGDVEIATREPPSWRSRMGVGCLIYISLRPLCSAIMQHLAGKPTQSPMLRPFHFSPPLSYLKYARCSSPTLTYCSVLLSGSQAL